MSISQPITVAVLGTGRQARAHAQALLSLGRDTAAALPPMEVLLYGRDEAKLASLATDLGVARTTSDLSEAIARATVVDNCLVNALHYGPCRAAVDAGKHCIVEKPLTGSVERSYELVRAADAAGVRHTIVQNMRYLPGPAAVKRVLDSGAVGPVFHVRAVFGYLVPETISNRPAWFYQRDQSLGGIVADIMSHFFDLFAWLVGPIESVFCQAATYLPHRRDATGRPFTVDVEDAAALVLRFQGGAMADVMLSWVRRKHESMPTFEIDGECGSLVFSYDQLRHQLGEPALHRYQPIAGAAEDPLAGWQQESLPPTDPFRQQLGAFLSAVVTDQPFEPNWHTGLRCERLIAAAYRSAAEGRLVSVEEIP